MYHQFNPTEMIRERHLALLKEAEQRHLARRLRSGRETKAPSSTVVALASGLLAALVMAGLMLVGLSTPARASTTFTVTNTNDSGAGSLNQAILDANDTSGADIINFNIPGSGVKTISPDAELPNITEALTINGYSQPGASVNTLAQGNNAVLKIELSGAEAPGGSGLRIGAANSTVKGLVINRWESGVRLGGNDASGNQIVGNYIGTNPSGTQDLGNNSGITIVDAPNNTIGGTTRAARNIISGNDGDGVQINGNGARGNKIIGNYLGTDKNGTADLGNGFYGVLIISAPNNTIGGTTAGERNVISGNGDDGVEIDGASATGNRVLSNSIFNNDELGIDLLGTNGPTANDPGDGDTGPNNLQNKPVLISARTSATSTIVRGTLNSTPNNTFLIQYFSNPSGNEGKTFIGQRSVTTDGSGNVTFPFSPAQRVGVGRTVTATATGPGGNTSEFSAARQVARQ
jgi:hypothetical protein